MNTNKIKPPPINEEQLEYIKEKIVRTYLFLIGQTAHDPKVLALMKLAALADVERRYEAQESW